MTFVTQWRTRYTFRCWERLTAVMKDSSSEMKHPQQRPVSITLDILLLGSNKRKMYDVCRAAGEKKTVKINIGTAINTLFVLHTISHLH